MLNSECVIEGSTMRVSCDFDENLDLFYKEFKKIDTLIFEDKVCDEVLTFLSSFDQPIILTPNILHLVFGEAFNQPIVLPSKIMYLIFGWYFNHPIILPSKIKYLTFGYEFNQPIVLPSKITYLTFGYEFNQSIVLPSKIRYLALECNNHNIADNLPNNIKRLILDTEFNLPLNNVPNTMTNIIIKDGKKYEHTYSIPERIISKQKLLSFRAIQSFDYKLKKTYSENVEIGCYWEKN